MSHDNMTPDNLSKGLGSDIPQPDKDAKARAIALAMAEFNAVQAGENAVLPEKNENIAHVHQGFPVGLRLISIFNHMRDAMMKFSRNQMIMGGMSTCAILVVAVVLTRQSLVLDESHPQPAMARAVLNNVTMARRQEQQAVKPAEMKKMAEMHVAQAREVAKSARALPMKQEMVAMREQKLMAPGHMAAAESDSMSSAVATRMAASPAPEYRDRFENFKENTVKLVSAEPVSTFSSDVDTASYSFVRRSINNGQLPQKDAVRIEEMVNYFDYDYALPASKEQPFQPNVAVFDSPWKAGNKLLAIGIKGYDIKPASRPDSNLVFLLDVSGSMYSSDKLPLVQQSMGLLLDTLKPTDTVAIVVYAGAAGTVLEPTKASQKQRIVDAINGLQAGGATAGAEGIERAYQLAEANFNPQGVNRIILATDGDFNVGRTADTDLKGFVERKREKGIYLSVLGFGQGNYQDAMMQTLAQSGNGVAAYIDTLSEAQKVLVHEASSTLFPIANDVKLQVEFNPATVAEYRLIGYETRALNREDFSNDKVDAGDIGAGHSVTALYEITPVGGPVLVEKGRYEKAANPAAKSASGEYAFVRIRYKLPGDSKSRLIEKPVSSKELLSLDGEIKPDSLQQEAGFATAVAGFAQLLRGSQYVGTYTYDDIIALALKTRGKDEYGYRAEFIQLVRKAKLAK